MEVWSAMKKAARKQREMLERINGPKPVPKAPKQKRDESHYHKGSCDMRRITEPGEGDWAKVQPGDFWWGTEAVDLAGKRYEYRTMWAKWPDGCMACLPIEPVAPEVKASPYARPTWKFDGNLERPTLTPSVHHIGHWHGWVRAGRMQSV